MMQVTKIWWDGDKLMADPIDPASVYKETEQLAPVQEPVQQWRQRHSPYWYDGYPDNEDGGGPYETRTVYTTPPAAQPAPVQEPVALAKFDGTLHWIEPYGIGLNRVDGPLYTTPPAQPAQQEPVASLLAAIQAEPVTLIHKWRVLELVKDYAPQRQWVGLTDDELEDCMEMSIQKTCRAIEAKLKELNI